MHAAPSETGDLRRVRRALVGLPAYNEERVIADLVESVHSLLGDLTIDHEILAVDDGSVDRTGAILDDSARRLPLVVVHHEQNQNLGGAMRSLMRLFAQRGREGDVLVCMDADNTFRPAQIPELLAQIEAGSDIAVASRYAPGGGTTGAPLYRNLLSLGANLLFRRLFPIEGISEYTCSFRAYRFELIRRAYAELGDPWTHEDGFTCMPEILIRLAELHPVASEIPVRIHYDCKVGPSKMKVAKNIVHTLRLLRRLRRAAAPGSISGTRTR